MLEIVLDTNVLVAALRSKRGASYQLIRSIGKGDWRLNISVALALEYEDVLKRKDMLRGISEPEVDEFILEVAMQCRAMIVTHNKRDFSVAEGLGVSVWTPGEFLKILREGQ